MIAGTEKSKSSFPIRSVPILAVGSMAAGFTFKERCII
jgi:hypothetical protein